jgi:hypothetical protein
MDIRTFFLKKQKTKSVQRDNQPIDWLLRVNDSRNLFDSSVYNTWGVESHTSDNKFFLNNVRPNDYLWFVKGGNCGGLLVAVSIFERSVKRVDGECISYEQLGWTNTTGSWDTDIYYKNFKKIADLNLLSQIKSPKVTRKYNQKCLVNLPEMRSIVYPPQLQEEEFTTVRRITIEGTSYKITTNADIQDESTRRFIVSLIAKENSDDEDLAEELCDEKESLYRILAACERVSDEISQLTSSLNARLAKL